MSAYQPSLKQIESAAAIHLPSDEFEAGDLPAAVGRSVDTVVTLSPDALENRIDRAAAKAIREIGQDTAVA